MGRQGFEAAARTPVKTFEELAQNGLRREAVPDPSGGLRRTLCAPQKLEHHNGAWRGVTLARF